MKNILKKTSFIILIISCFFVACEKKEEQKKNLKPVQATKNIEQKKAFSIDEVNKFLLDKEKKKAKIDLKQKRFVLFYFSASWCPPCKPFTKRLVRLYKKLEMNPIAHTFDVVLVGADSKESEAQQYMKDYDMPWKMLDYKKRHLVTAQAQTIPRLLIYDIQKKQIVAEGSHDILTHLETTFESMISTFESKLDVAKLQKLLVNSQGVKVEGSLVKKRYIMLYYSASWCPPCKKFTPLLIDFYRSTSADKRDFEIILIGGDYSAKKMYQYMIDYKLPWLALQYDKKKMFPILKTLRYLPSVIVYDRKNNKVVHTGSWELLKILKQKYKK